MPIRAFFFSSLSVAVASPRITLKGAFTGISCLYLVCSFRFRVWFPSLASGLGSKVIGGIAPSLIFSPSSTLNVPAHVALMEATVHSKSL